MACATTFYKPEIAFEESGRMIFGVLPTGTVLISDGDKVLEFTDEGKPVFINDKTGEHVLEYTGLATDGRSDRSWAKASFMNQGNGSPLHYHKEREESYFITQGVGEITIDKKKQMVKQGDHVIVNAGSTHTIINTSTTPLVLFVKCAPSWIPSDQHEVPVEAAGSPEL